MNVIMHVTQRRTRNSGKLYEIFEMELFAKIVNDIKQRN